MSLTECYLSDPGFCRTYGMTPAGYVLVKVLFAGGEFI